MEQETIPKRLYTIKETTIITSLGLTSVYSLVADGTLEAKKFGSKTLVTAESIEAFIASLPNTGGDNG